jgi:hypothetical protein
VLITVAASDPSPGSGVREVRFSYSYCPGFVCGGENGLGSDNTGPSPYTMNWIFPTCGSAPEDAFRIFARATDNCGNVSDPARVDVRLTGRGCFRGPTESGATRAGSWQSELSAPGASGQVVVDGTTAVFPSAGQESFATPLAPGAHRFEATLVGAGRSGAGARWRFDLSTLRVAPGSLRVVAGDVFQLGADAVVFRLRGRAGERVVFTFEVAAE